MNNYSCRDNDTGSLKITRPGQPRTQFCPGCQHQGQKSCLFHPPPPTLPPANPRRARPHNSNKIPTAQMIAVIKRAWRDLGHQPKLIEIRPPYSPTGGHISKSYPGGFKAAVKEAQRQLVIEEGKCPEQPQS
jgi:hypothetical protein